jgi:hypothetical protein
MTEIPIYDSKGIQVDSITINESVEYVNGRVCKSDTCYYKGIGIPYVAHSVLYENLTDEYDYIEKSPVFYAGNTVSKKCFQNKTGIFQERFQPQFTEWIGSCGFKELNILENLYDEHKFERNSIEVLSYETINEAEIEREYENYLKSRKFPENNKDNIIYNKVFGSDVKNGFIKSDQGGLFKKVETKDGYRQSRIINSKKRVT